MVRSEVCVYIYIIDVWFCKKWKKYNRLLFAGALYSQLTGASKNMHVYQFAGMTLTKEFEVVHERLAQKNKEAEEEEQTIVTS